MLRRTWSSSSTLRGWLGTGMTQLPTRAGCMQLKWGTLLLCYLPPPKLLCLPPLPKMPCCNPDCQRCAAHSGGFKFPWIGLWNTRGVVIPPDVAPSEAWDYYYRHNERMDLILLSAYSSQVTAEELVPQDLYALQLRCSAGDAGALGRGEFFAAWREWALCFPDLGTLPPFMDPRLFPRAPRGRPWASLGAAGSKAHRALRGWLEAQEAGHLELGSACIGCGDPTWRRCWACCVGLCAECFAWRHNCTHCGEKRKMLTPL